jgi:hypothetical protein
MEPLTLLGLMAIPVIACLALGALLLMRGSWWGVRLKGLAYVLVNLLPGTLILAEVASGGLQPPAAFFGVVAVGLGLLLLRRLRDRWRPPIGWPALSSGLPPAERERAVTACRSRE